MRRSWPVATRFAPFALALICSACSIPLEDAAGATFNRCSTSSDCGPDAACVDDGAGSTTCVATKADLTGLLVEVRPSAASVGGNTRGQVQSGAGYLLEPEQAGLRLGGSDLAGAISWDANLPPPVDIIDGRVKAFAGGDGCAMSAGDSIRAEVFFSRSVSHVGLPSSEYHTVAEQRPDGSFVFEVSLPAGKYDVYVKPQLHPACAVEPAAECCVELPPYLVRELDISAGNSHLNIPLPERQPLDGTLDVSEALNINGWTVALVDRVSGNLISTEPALVQADLAATQFSVTYHPTTGGTEPYQPPFVRVRSPAPEFSPVALWPLEVADANGDKFAELTIGDSLTKPVDVEGQVLAADEGSGVESTVTLVGSFNKPFVLFERTLTTDPEGRFSTQVFPTSVDEAGTYNVFARPVQDDTADAIGMASDWEIHADEACFCGHSVILPERSVVSAQVLTHSGEPINAPVSAKQSANAEDAVTPRPVQSDIVSGSLSLRLDPGTYDVAIKPEAGSGYPWLVTSQLQILTDQATTALGPLEVPFPVMLRGRVLDAMGQPVPHASLTGWLPVVDPANESSSVVQIAETVSDADGAFVLLLPPKLTH